MKLSVMTFCIKNISIKTVSTNLHIIKILIRMTLSIKILTVTHMKILSTATLNIMTL
jgi:hypothetical protein